MKEAQERLASLAKPPDYLIWNSAQRRWWR